MITVTIGGSRLDLTEATPEWINQQVHRRRAAGETVCVQVQIDEPGATMLLASSDCPPRGGGNRPPNALEEKIFHLWEQQHLDKEPATGGHLVAFLSRLKSLL